MNPIIIIGGIALLGLLAGMAGGQPREAPPGEQPPDNGSGQANLSASIDNLDVSVK